MDSLQYQAAILIAGRPHPCVESYEAILDRLRDSRLKTTGNEDSLQFSWPEPIELTIGGPENRPLRAAVNPQSISYVVEIPADDREDVAE